MSGAANCSKVSERISTCTRLTQLVEELPRAGQWSDAGDHVGDVGQPEPVLGEQFEAAAHQDVVVGLVAGGAAQRIDARALGHRDPDLGHEHAFEVEGHDLLAHVGVVGAVVIERQCYGRLAVAANPAEIAASRPDRHR